MRTQLLQWGDALRNGKGDRPTHPLSAQQHFATHKPLKANHKLGWRRRANGTVERRQKI